MIRINKYYSQRDLYRSDVRLWNKLYSFGLMKIANFRTVSWNSFTCDSTEELSPPSKSCQKTNEEPFCAGRRDIKTFRYRHVRKYCTRELYSQIFHFPRGCHKTFFPVDPIRFFLLWRKWLIGYLYCSIYASLHLKRLKTTLLKRTRSD